MVYLASGLPLPTRGWEPDQPPFHAREIREGEAAVRRHFTKPHVYYLGAYEACGCGFQVGEYPGQEDEEDAAKARESRRLLVEFLRRALEDQDEIELLACWADEEGAEPQHRGRVTPEDLVGGRTYFLDKEFLVIGRKRPGRRKAFRARLFP